MTILDKMLENCKNNGFQPTENIEKLLAPKNMMFGEQSWQRCPSTVATKNATAFPNCAAAISNATASAIAAVTAKQNNFTG